MLYGMHPVKCKASISQKIYTACTILRKRETNTAFLRNQFYHINPIRIINLMLMEMQKY